MAVERVEFPGDPDAARRFAIQTEGSRTLDGFTVLREVERPPDLDGFYHRAGGQVQAQGGSPPWALFDGAGQVLVHPWRGESAYAPAHLDVVVLADAAGKSSPLMDLGPVLATEQDVILATDDGTPLMG